MPLSLAQIQALLADNTTGDISEADARDVATALFNWIPYLDRYRMGRQAGETDHADDDFFTSYSGYTEANVTGSATWAVSNNGLTCYFNSQSANDLSVSLKAITAGGPPITIETMFNGSVLDANNPGFGICFTSGTASSSSAFAVGGLANFDNVKMTGTLTSMTSTAITNIETGFHLSGPTLWRVIWKSADTWAWCISPDGGTTWTDFGESDVASTFTPTHVGFWVTAWGQTTKQVATWAYLRVYEADLSV
jgi:hypothetical protein